MLIAVAVAADLEVFIGAPGAAPRVVHEVVVVAGAVGAIANSDVRMVKVDASIAPGDHTTLIVAVCS